MHELAIAQNLLEIIREEMKKHEKTRLITVKVKHGRLSSVVPEALEMAFTSMTMDTSLADAALVMESVPLTLKCHSCGKEFSPENASHIFIPCTHCGEEVGHEVVSGKELFIEYLELE
jgi:hydrogenase nickel incorporation protein HypA/HybF